MVMFQHGESLWGDLFLPMEAAATGNFFSECQMIIIYVHQPIPTFLYTGVSGYFQQLFPH